MQRTVHVAGGLMLLSSPFCFSIPLSFDMNEQLPRTKITFPTCLVPLVVDCRNIKWSNGSWWVFPKGSRTMECRHVMNQHNRDVSQVQQAVLRHATNIFLFLITVCLLLVQQQHYLERDGNTRWQWSLKHLVSYASQCMSKGKEFKIAAVGFRMYAYSFNMSDMKNW